MHDEYVATSIWLIWVYVCVCLHQQQNTEYRLIVRDYRLYMFFSSCTTKLVVSLMCVFNFDAICPNLYYCFIPLLLRVVIETVIEYIEWIWNETMRHIQNERRDREIQTRCFAHLLFMMMINVSWLIDSISFIFFLPTLKKCFKVNLNLLVYISIVACIKTHIYKKLKQFKQNKCKLNPLTKHITYIAASSQVYVPNGFTTQENNNICALMSL